MDADKKLQECEQYDCEVVQEELVSDMIVESEESKEGVKRVAIFEAASIS